MNSNERPPLPQFDVTTSVEEFYCLFSGRLFRRKEQNSPENNSEKD